MTKAATACVAMVQHTEPEPSGSEAQQKKNLEDKFCSVPLMSKGAHFRMKMPRGPSEPDPDAAEKGGVEVQLFIWRRCSVSHLSPVVAWSNTQLCSLFISL